MITLNFCRMIGGLICGVYDALCMYDTFIHLYYTASYGQADTKALAPGLPLVRGIMGRAFRFIRSW